MVGKNEETVVSDEKTVSFLNAIEHLKEHDGKGKPPFRYRNFNRISPPLSFRLNRTFISVFLGEAKIWSCRLGCRFFCFIFR